MAPEASHLDVAASVAIFAVAHFHAFVRRPPQPGDGVSPDIAAVSAYAIHLVGAHLVGFTVSGMAFRASQCGPLHMDCVRKPDVGWLPSVDEPRSLVSRLDKVVDQCLLRLALSNPFGMAGRAPFHGWNPSKGSILAYGVALVAFRDARLFRMRLVTKLERLLLLCV